MANNKQRTHKDPNRPLMQKTCDIYKDQNEYLTKLGKKVGRPVQFLIRAAIDAQYGLPKLPKNDTAQER